MINRCSLCCLNLKQEEVDYTEDVHFSSPKQALLACFFSAFMAQATFNTQALILRRSSFRESDSRIVVYSPQYGKFDLVARGARKLSSKLRSHVEPLTLTNLMVIRGKRFDYVGSAEGDEFFKEIKENYDKVVSAGEVLRIFDKLMRAEDETDAAQIFALLLDYLGDLSVCKKNIELRKYLFLWRLLANIGFRPQIESCEKCENAAAEKYYFEPLSGHLICGECLTHESSAVSVDKPTLGILKKSLLLSNKQLVGIDIDTKQVFELIRVIKLFFINQTQEGLKRNP